MFLCSVRFNKKKLALTLAVVVTAVVVGLLLLSGAGSHPAVLPEDCSGGTEEERIAFLAYFGWEVDGEATEMDDVTIPAHFNDVFETYNAIQKAQNCDLTPYNGKTVRRYVYSITNPPEGESDVFAHLLIYEGKIIGGDIACSRLDGWMRGFAREEAQR